MLSLKKKSQVGCHGDDYDVTEDDDFSSSISSESRCACKKQRSCFHTNVSQNSTQWEKNTQSTECEGKELLLNRMFYKVSHKASAVPPSTTSLNMDSRPEITVFTKLACSLHNLSFQRLHAYFMCAQS